MSILHRLHVRLRARRLERHRRFMQSIKGMYVFRPNPLEPADYRDFQGNFRRESSRG